jgi:hypothetical protein
MRPKCVARYLVEVDTILCGNPDIPWIKDSDILTKEEKKKRSEDKYCSRCISLETALDKAINARARMVQP